MTSWRYLTRIGAPGLGVALLIATTVMAEEQFLFADALKLLVVVSLGCSLVGTWLVLRRMAMMADAIGHSILLGIVVMFFFVNDPSSPAFVIGAALSGLLTVFLTEAFLATGRVREDASIGMVFSFLFALALVLIGVFFRDAHVDQHLVLAGGVEVTVLRQVVIESWTVPGWLASTAGGLLQGLLPGDNVLVYPDGRMIIDGLLLGPRSLWTMSAILLASTVFVGLLWKELKLATFDPLLAASLGFAPALINYGLMAMVAVTAVGAFEAVGSILVIALFVGPPATAYLLTRDLRELLGLSLVIAGFNAWLGYLIARSINVNFGGAVAMVCGAVFLVAMLLAPGEGLVTQVWERRRRRRAFALDTLLVHLLHHEDAPESAVETATAEIPRHMHWDAARAKAIVHSAVRGGFVVPTNGHLRLTEVGRSRSQAALMALGPEAAPVAPDAH